MWTSSPSCERSQRPVETALLKSSQYHQCSASRWRLINHWHVTYPTDTSSWVAHVWQWLYCLLGIVKALLWHWGNKSVCSMLSPPQAVSGPWQRLSPLLFACHHITWDCNSMRFHELWSWLGIGAEVLAKGTLKDSVLNTGSYWVSLSPVQSISLLSLQILPQSSLCNPKMRCPVASIASVSLSRDGCCISLIMKWSLCIVS